MSQFARGLGRMIGAILVAAVEVKAEARNDNRAMAAENAESAKWDQRKQEALAAIERALVRHYDKDFTYTNHRREDRAVTLRHQVNTQCRNRSESLMSHTEEQIMRFEKNGW